MTSPDFGNMTQQEIVDHIVNSMMELVREDLAKNSIKVLEKDEISVKTSKIDDVIKQLSIANETGNNSDYHKVKLMLEELKKG